MCRCLTALLLSVFFVGCPITSVWAQDCPRADLTQDCRVDFDDLLVFGLQWLDDSGGSANIDNVGIVDIDDFVLLAADWRAAGAPPVTLVINEFMADNEDFFRDPAGEDDDWIEIYNYGSRPLDIGGMFITDNAADMDPWQIPDDAPDETTIPARGYLILWADNDAGAPATGGQGPLHTDFALSRGGEEIVLLDRDRNLLDGIVFGPQGENDSYGRLPNAGTEWRVFVEGTQMPPTPGQSNGGVPPEEEILITEIMYHPNNGEPSPAPGVRVEDIHQEYLEIHNRGFSAVDLTGWRFTDGVDYTFGTASIGPGEYLVIAADVAAFAEKYPSVQNVIGGWDGRLSNSGETVELTMPTGRVIDRLHYADKGDWAPRVLGPVDHRHRGWTWSDAHDGDGKSLELIGMSMPNEYGPNWAASLVQHGTPGRANSATGEPPETIKLVDTGADWRYLDDGSDQMTLWKEPNFVDTGWASGPSELGYGDDDEATVVGYGTSGSNKHITTYFRHSFEVADKSRLASTEIQLIRDDGAVVYLNGSELFRSNMPQGSINYLTLAPENIAGSAETEPVYYSLDPDLLNNGMNILAVEIHQDSATSTDISLDLILEGTVKQQQQPEQDIAPLIVDAKHRPFIPGSTDLVTVTAEVIDEQAVGVVVTVHYRPDGQATFDTAAMLDDGQNGDVEASDSIFTARIPAQADGAVVEFYIEAKDAGDNVRTRPAPCDVDGTLTQSCNMLYQVDDSFDPDAEWRPGDRPVYYIIMTEAERAELEQIGRGTNGNEEDSDAQMNATFISVDGVDTKIRYNVGVRNRGHGTRDDRPNNYRVNFPTDRPWKGVVAVNLNTRYTWLQLAGSALFRRSGLATGDATAVQVRVNGQNLAGSGPPQYGSYVHIEAINSEYFDHHFPDNGAGNSYKCMRVGGEADLRYMGAEGNDYRDRYFKSTNVSQDDWSDLIDLTYALSDNTPDDIYVQEVNRVVNVNQWLRFLALNVLLRNAETTIANGDGDDYYLYRGDRDSRAVLIQHDLDSIFGRGQSTPRWSDDDLLPFMSGSDGNENPVAALLRMVGHPEFAPLYYGHLRDLAETILSPEQLGPFLHNLLGGFVPSQEIDSMVSYMSARNDLVLSLIPSELTVDSDLFQIGELYRTDANAVTLSGYADAVDTRSVTLNGLPAEWSAIDATWNIGAGSTMPNEEMIVRRQSTWKYLDDGSDQGTAWYGFDFDDTAWDSGRARLGYGNDGEVTTVGFGPDSRNKYITTYFRLTFNVDDPSEYSNLRLGVLRDDGAVVYLNGSELWRSTNLPAGPITYRTFAERPEVGGEDEDTFFGPAPTLDPALLNVGRNVLAVEIHQVSVTSSDISFDLELAGILPATGVVTGVPVNPGITRIIVQAFDGPGGTGNEIDRKYIDIWKTDDAGTPTNLSGTLTEDLTLDAASGPYIVTGDVIIPPGITLSIEAGSTLFFNTGTGITINGRLVAEGTQFGHVYMGPNPQSATRWDGLDFDNTLDENRLVYVDMDRGDGQGDSILVDDARLFMNYMTFVSTDNDTAIMELTHPSAIIRNTVFPSISGTEPLHGTQLSGNEYLIFDGCTFGSTTGYNDIVDFSGGDRPGPIIQFYNCTFLGGGDDGPDLDGTDAHIEGCSFTNFHQAAGSSSPSYAVATGDGSEVCIVRNVFIDNDHCFLHKEDVYTWAQNNVFIDSTIAAVSFGEPFRNPKRTPGRGTYMDSNIHLNNAATFEHYFDVPGDPTYGPTGPVYVYRSILPAAWHLFGTGNLDTDPMFVNPNDDLSLQPGSPAKGTGINGLDMGYLVPAGASVSGEPAPVSNSTEATLYVGGPGITHYKYRLVDNGVPGAWSSELPIPIDASDYPADPDNILATLQLTGLEEAHTYRVDVLGKNSAGMWQGQPFGTNTGFVVPGNPEGNSSQSWTVNLSGQAQAVSESTGADDTMSRLMEIYNNPPEMPSAPAHKSMGAIQGVLTGDSTWTAEDGPYQVTGELIVPVGVTLTIEAGTTVFFDAGVQLTVNGRIRAEGVEYNLIRFTKTPTSGGTWNGIQLVDTVEDNLISHAVIAYTNYTEGSIGLNSSSAVLEHLTWRSGSRRRLIRTLNASVIIRNCVFPDRFGPGEVPGPGDDNIVESIKATGILPGGRFIIENNVFGTNKGHNDVIDFSGPGRPGPILQVINNIFMGGGDELLDLGGDALIEGNLFQHVHMDQWNNGTGESNVMSTGDDNFDAVLSVVRNVFYDIDHAVNLKTGTYMYFEHNTVVGIPDDQGDDRYSVINFLIPGRDPQGKGAYLNGNIFRDIPQRIFDHVDEDLNGTPDFQTDLVMHNCLIPAGRAGDIVSTRLGTTMDLGQGNFVGDPLFVDPTGDFHLRASSSARKAAPGGIDLGAYAPAGASVSGEPATTTWRTDATLTVAGPGVSDYRYRLNSGAWSSEYPVDTPIALSGLEDGPPYTIEVIGKNFAGEWQSESEPGVSQTWTVDTAYSKLVINEVLAHNVATLDYLGTAPDLIELYYDGAEPISLEGMSITDNPAEPTKYVFAPDAAIDPGQYLVLYADSITGTNGIHLGFAVSDRGEGVYLYDSAGSLVDSVEFGMQVIDLSIGRDDEGAWRLTQPTFGAANITQPLGDRSRIKINEWFANGDILFVDDFIEFYNPDIYPVDLGGIYITDNPVSQPEKYQLAPLNFIAGAGFADFDADAQSNPGHLPFRLSSNLEMIAIYASDTSPIDAVLYGPQTTDVSQGRSGDGDAAYGFFTIPTPGVSNPFVAGGDTIEINLIGIENEWAYDQSDTDLGTAWREPDYADNTWPTGRALLYVESSPLPAPKNTPLTLGAATYYFRSHFTIPAEVDIADIIELNVATVVDDAAVIFINGAEALRVGFNQDTVVIHTTWSDRGAVGNAVYEYFTIPAANLLPGDNVIAVEVHQTSAGSSDIVFGLVLDAVVDVSQNEDPLADAGLLLDNLRITELMYHPPGGSNYEFIELQNIGPDELDLTGVRLDGGIEYTFDAVTLAAGEYVVVANNRVVFQTFYGSGLNLAAGEYTGNLSNGGEDIILRLAAPLRAAILRFAYNDAWYPTTDGGGYSLVIRDATAHPATWDDAESWTASTDTNGSPGSAD